MDAKDYIKKHNLTPHPEGGWYRQVYGNDVREGGTITRFPST